MTLALIEDSLYFNDKSKFWDNVYGINMSSMKKWILS